MFKIYAFLQLLTGSESEELALHVDTVDFLLES